MCVCVCAYGLMMSSTFCLSQLWPVLARVLKMRATRGWLRLRSPPGRNLCEASLHSFHLSIIGFFFSQTHFAVNIYAHHVNQRFPVNLDVVTVQNFDSFLAKKFFVVRIALIISALNVFNFHQILKKSTSSLLHLKIELQVCVPTIYGKLYPRLICCPDHTVSLAIIVSF